MKIEVGDDYGFLLKEVFTGIGLVSPAGEEFGICMRDSGFEFRYGNTWHYAKGGEIGSSSDNKVLFPGPSSVEQDVQIKVTMKEGLPETAGVELWRKNIEEFFNRVASIEMLDWIAAMVQSREELNSLSEPAKKEKNGGENLGVISLDGELHEIEEITELPNEKIIYKSTKGIEQSEVLGPEGSFEESCIGYGPFDLNRVYEQKDVCTWLGNVWRFIGHPWASNPGIGYRTHTYTQKRTIGVYPSEMYGWRKI